MREPSVTLSAQDVGLFHAQGFVELPVMTTQAEAAFIAGVLRGLWRELLGGGRDGAGGLLAQIVNPVEYAPQLLDTRLRANAAAVARQLLGAEARFSGEQALIKTAGEQRVVWHQDEAHWPGGYHYEAVTIWVPLVETTEENGCMMFAPGSHRGGVLAHRAVNPAADEPDLSLAQEPAAWRACPSAMGGGSAHGPRTVHASAPNRSGQPRLAYSMGFMNRPVKLC